MIGSLGGKPVLQIHANAQIAARAYLCADAQGHHPDTDAQIKQLTAWVDQAGVQGLPMIWIHDQHLVGKQIVKSLEAALDRAQLRKQ